MTRESVEGREVERPPTAPSVRRCRSAERDAVVSAVGSRGRVLDLGSAPCVTAEVRADSIERVDFSRTESERARDTLGVERDGSAIGGRDSPAIGGRDASVGGRDADPSTVEGFTVVDPGAPALPFPDDSFAAAVAVGPYDWPTLDAETVTREVGRVLEPDGRYVLSTLSPRSPDVSTGDPLHGRDAGATRDLLAPGWELERCDRVRRRDGSSRGLVGSVASRARAVVDRCRDALPGVALSSVALPVRRDRRERTTDAPVATVAVGRPLPYERWLESALECLFRPVEDGGFWDPAAGRFVPALAAESSAGTPIPIRDSGAERTRTPFVAARVLRWRTSGAGTDAYDDEIRRLLARLRSLAESEGGGDRLPPAPTGALIAALARAGAGPFDDANASLARDCFERSLGRSFDGPADAALLEGWAVLATAASATGRDDGADDRILAALDEGLGRAADELFSQPGGAFVDPTVRPDEGHLRALVGLCRAVEVTGRDDALAVAASVLEDVVDGGIRDDGTVVLDPARRESGAGAVVTDLEEGGGSVSSGDRRPRHQSAFVETVARYVAAGGPPEYDREVAGAMAALDGGGSLEGSLLEAGALDVPPRVVGPDGPVATRITPPDADGEADATDGIVTGVDDVGALVGATTALTAGSLAPATPVGPERIPAPTGPR